MDTISPTLCFLLSHVVEGEEPSAFAANPMCLNFNTDHFPNLPSPGNHLGRGRLAKFSELLFRLSSLLPDSLFVWRLGTPRNSIGSWSFRWKDSLCILPAFYLCYLPDARAWRIPLTTLGAGK